MLEILMYILTGLSLSVDALTMAISYGTIIGKSVVKKQLSILVGIFHFMMPIFGFIITNKLSKNIFINTKYLITIIFIILIIEMCKEDTEHEKTININLVTIILTCLAVSIDSMSIGIVIGLTKGKIIIASIIFSIISFIATLIGLSVGEILKEKNKKISKIIAILLFLLVAVKYLIFA